MYFRKSCFVMVKISFKLYLQKQIAPVRIKAKKHRQKAISPLDIFKLSRILENMPIEELQVAASKAKIIPFI